jgi:beta-lactamase class D
VKTAGCAGASRALIIVAVVVVFATAALAADETWSPRPDWERYFKDAGVVGTIVVADERDGARYGWNIERAATRFSPASTFKVPHLLFALDAGVARDEFQVFPWDGVSRDIAGWNADQTLRSSLRYSVVWLYQEFARAIGREREHEYLAKADYGNRVIGDGVDTFWLDGSLRISALEQVAFLQKLYRNQLPFAVEHQRLVKDLLINEVGRDWILRAKTGRQATAAESVGWWVGWVETPTGAVFFALNLTMPGGAADAPIGRAVLRDLGVFPQP